MAEINKVTLIMDTIKAALVQEIEIDNLTPAEKKTKTETNESLVVAKSPTHENNKNAEMTSEAGSTTITTGDPRNSYQERMQFSHNNPYIVKDEQRNSHAEDHNSTNHNEVHSADEILLKKEDNSMEVESNATVEEDTPIQQLRLYSSIVKGNQKISER
ncbi:35965_t:CDS:2 [Gigaspora margarita]|uniref:35965_t:CDS:1 n=1 Tax=Gigaspora margarita TaxID=4874 RepID=A0ABN7U8W5_GIGMA|nr:35965_t:CDS:2 [Gigaspora margarita]